MRAAYSVVFYLDEILGENIIELDAFSRTYGMDESLFFPVLALFDFGSAFPSLIQQWMFLVFQVIGIPEGAYHILNAVYFVVQAVGRIAGSSSRHLFFILSGIIQGCPLAGTCFAIAMDPFLALFKHTVDDQCLGCIRACSDDIGAALARFRCSQKSWKFSAKLRR